MPRLHSLLLTAVGLMLALASSAAAQDDPTNRSGSSCRSRRLAPTTSSRAPSRRR